MIKNVRIKESIRAVTDVLFFTNSNMGSRLFHRLGSSAALFSRKDCFLWTNKRLISCLQEGKVVVRPAKASDFDEVLQLSKKLKDAFDYLPYRFHKWLLEPDRISLVAPTLLSPTDFINGFWSPTESLWLPLLYSPLQIS